MNIVLSDEFKNNLQAIIDSFDHESNEATRTHRIVSRILNEIEDLSKLEYSYIAKQPKHENKQLDFLLSHKDKEFFIVEANAKLDTIYLRTHTFKYGCLTDGFLWLMYEWDGERTKLKKTIVISDAQDIVDYIISKSPNSQS